MSETARDLRRRANGVRDEAARRGAMADEHRAAAARLLDEADHLYARARQEEAREPLLFVGGPVHGRNYVIGELDEYRVPTFDDYGAVSTALWTENIYLRKQLSDGTSYMLYHGTK